MIVTEGNSFRTYRVHQCHRLSNSKSHCVATGISLRPRWLAARESGPTARRSHKDAPENTMHGSPSRVLAPRVTVLTVPVIVGRNPREIGDAKAKARASLAACPLRPPSASDLAPASGHQGKPSPPRCTCRHSHLRNPADLTFPAALHDREGSGTARRTRPFAITGNRALTPVPAIFKGPGNRQP